MKTRPAMMVCPECSGSRLIPPQPGTYYKPNNMACMYCAGTGWVPRVMTEDDLADLMACRNEPELRDEMVKLGILEPEGESDER